MDMIIFLVTSLASFGISLGAAHLLMVVSLRIIFEARAWAQASRSGEPGLAFLTRARAPEVSSLGGWHPALEVTAFPPASKPYGFGKIRRSVGEQMVLFEPRNADQPRESLSGLAISPG